MFFKETLECLWTDGGDGGNAGYFDSAGELNCLLQKMFSGRVRNHKEKIPIEVNVTDSMRYGTKVRITVIIEELN